MKPIRMIAPTLLSATIRTLQQQPWLCRIHRPDHHHRFTVITSSMRSILNSVDSHPRCCLFSISTACAQKQQQGLSTFLLLSESNSQTVGSGAVLQKMTIRSVATMRGGDSNDPENVEKTTSTTATTTSQQKYTVLSEPAPGSPFHHAFPVHDLQLAKEFYGTVLGCVEGRSSTKWQDYSLHGHQIVAHYVGPDYRCQDYYNPVDGDEVPVPHTGLALTVDQFHSLAERLRKANVPFIIEPHLRFVGQPGEQYTMFFKDPSGNNLEFKAMTHPENLFAKYNVVDH